MAGNQLGKCATISSYVSLADGRTVQVGDLVGRSSPVPVWAFDGRERVRAEALPFFEKQEEHDCYRIYLSDASWVELSGEHVLLTDSGWLSIQNLLTFWPDLQESISGSSPRARASSALRWLRSTRDSRDDCRLESRFDDEQLRLEAGISSGGFPSRDDARERGRSSLKTDGPGYTDIRIPRIYTDQIGRAHV